MSIKIVVKKKNERLRLVLDSRGSNKLFRPLPRMRMGTAAAWRRVELAGPRFATKADKLREKLYVAQLDIRNFSMPCVTSKA